MTDNGDTIVEKREFFKVVRISDDGKYRSAFVPDNLEKEYSTKFRTDEGVVFGDLIVAMREFESLNPFLCEIWKCDVLSFDEILYLTNYDILYGNWKPPVGIKPQLILRKDVRIDDVLLACWKSGYLISREGRYLAKGIQLTERVIFIPERMISKTYRNAVTQTSDFTNLEKNDGTGNR